MTNAELFKMASGRKWLYNIMPIGNLPSVMLDGILCYNRTRCSAHHTIAMESVQALRDRKRIPGGLALHDYASLYFNPRNPMMFKRKELFRNICVLVIEPSVLDFDGTVVSDGNAANGVSRFYSPSEGLRCLEYKKIFDRYWRHGIDPISDEEHKRIECAEVLVPYQVPYHYILGAYVAIEEVRNKLTDIRFDKPVKIKSDIFFQRGGESK